MKKIFTFFAAALLMLLMANCTTQTSIPENLRKEWKLVELDGFTKQQFVDNNAGINLIGTKENPGKYSANMGCNNMFFSAKFVQGSAIFSEVGSTMMYCDRGMDLESAFAATLAKMTNYSVDGHYLTLTGPTGERMKFVAADWD